jgi:hypothetical protein
MNSSVRITGWAAVIRIAYFPTANVGIRSCSFVSDIISVFKMSLLSGGQSDTSPR